MAFKPKTKSPVEVSGVKKAEETACTKARKQVREPRLFGGISDKCSCSEEQKWGKTRKVGKDQILKGLLSLLGVGGLILRVVREPLRVFSHLCFGAITVEHSESGLK